MSSSDPGISITSSLKMFTIPGKIDNWTDLLMDLTITTEDLITHGVPKEAAPKLANEIQSILQDHDSASAVWQALCQLPIFSSSPFPAVLWLFSKLCPNWREHPEQHPVWQPTPDFLSQAHLNQYANEKSISDITQLQEWSHENFQTYWSDVVTKLNIQFIERPSSIVDIKDGISQPNWFPNAKMNIAQSCFNAKPNTVAIICQDPSGTRSQITYEELDQLSNQVANSLITKGYQAGDAIAIVMPMNIPAVAIYLGIIKMGGVVITVPDSFSAQEISTRLSIADTKLVFTQDQAIWAGKTLPLYEKLSHATKLSIPIVVIPQNPSESQQIESPNLAWSHFLDENSHFDAVACDPMTATNILFSSGTTSTPKAIPWTHTTPIKAGADAYFHQNIQAGDILAWPTSLGWMMGPWLIYAALLNQATIALFPDAPKDEVFGKYVQDIGVTMLGVVPTLVAAWRKSQCMENLDWSKIKLFSSTGECSNPEDMFYLMWLAGFKPIIEYCGGTEIGGAYITSTLLEPNYPSILTTPAMGSAFVLIDENNQETEHQGEVAIIPPGIGLSTTLLNKDHHETYYKDMPKSKSGQTLRRHGDQIKKLNNRAYCMMGRVDDAMNLGGIKVSATEIERIITNIDGIQEVAAIAISPPNNGPHQLVICAVPSTEDLDKNQIAKKMQKLINQHLNPLFKISDVMFTSSLPKTASNKIMRRVLRDNYEESAQ